MGGLLCAQLFGCLCGSELTFNNPEIHTLVFDSCKWDTLVVFIISGHAIGVG